MKIIISPAKKMNVDTDSIAWRDLPVFLADTEELCGKLRSMSGDALKSLWKCNDQIAALNVERLRNMDLRRGLTPAILAYEGIQYQYMAPGVFSEREFTYIQDHLRILSGFYSPEDDLGVWEEKIDLAVDAIDTVSAKADLIFQAQKRGVKVISCMGAGNKTDPSAFVAADLFETQVCPLCRVMRKAAREKGIELDNIQLQNDSSQDGDVGVLATVQRKRKEEKKTVLTAIQELPSVQFLEEL